MFRWWTALFFTMLAVAVVALFATLFHLLMQNWTGGIVGAIIMVICVFIAAGVSGNMEDEI